MDGISIALQAPEKAEGEDADSQADKGHHYADPSDDSKQQLVVISNAALEIKQNILYFHMFLISTVYVSWKRETKAPFCPELVKTAYAVLNYEEFCKKSWTAF